MLVGDFIIRLRELGPDPCTALGAPASPTIGAAPPPVPPPNLPAGTYYYIATQLTSWGESIGTTEGTVTITNPPGAFVLSLVLSAAATGVRVYLGVTPGGETQYQAFNVSPTILGLPINLVVTGTTLLPGVPPSRSRAYLPDSDGSFCSAVTAYAWLGEALLALSKASQGVYDFTGMPSSNGQPLYTLVGQWEDLDHAWYDGWIMDIGNKAQIYYRNRIATSIAGMMAFQRIADLMTVELFPQPNRTANSTTLSGNVPTGQISATTTSANVAISNFVLPMGLALFGSGPSAEIVAYAFNSAGQLTGMVRGIGGTVAQSWPDGTLVTELNIRVSGRRIVTPYPVGASASSIPAPPEWAAWLPLYMLSRFREAEGEHKLAVEMRQEFSAIVDKLGRGNKQRGGPRQIGAGPQVGEVYGGTLGGGWLLP